MVRLSISEKTCSSTANSTPLRMPLLRDMQAASKRIGDIAVHTPLLRLQTRERHDIYIKLELLQPIGSFKIRCAANALLQRMENGARKVSTASAGNFAQGLAYVGQTLQIPVATYVPEEAARSKIAALERLGAEVIQLPYGDWWAMLEDPTDDPGFIHPAADIDVIAGNATIGLEILDELPDVATVIAP